MKTRHLILVLIALICSPSWSAETTTPRQRTLLDADWLFHPGDISPTDQVITAGFDDAQWQHVDVPHDYVLGGKYAQSDDRKVRGHGYLPYDVGWYRKRLVIPAS